MKWIVSVLLSGALLLGSGAIRPVQAQDISVPEEVGKIGGEIAPGFQGKEELIRERFREAYAWGSGLSAWDGGPDSRFDFGEMDTEYVHEWQAEHPVAILETGMIQLFYEGNSSAVNALARDNTAALLCSNPETMRVFILRDAVAEDYFKTNGNINGGYGYPISNQYWRMEEGIPVLYQQFTLGYYRAEWGEPWYACFYNQEDEGSSYVEPPVAPDPSAPIDQPSSDGCTWEDPRIIEARRLQEESQTSDSNSVSEPGRTSAPLYPTDPSRPDLFITSSYKDVSPASSSSTMAFGLTSAEALSDVAAFSSRSTSSPSVPVTASAAEKTDERDAPRSVLPIVLGTGGLVLVAAAGVLVYFYLRRKNAPPKV